MLYLSFMAMQIKLIVVGEFVGFIPQSLVLRCIV